jgi:hypothetical protein
MLEEMDVPAAKPVEKKATAKPAPVSQPRAVTKKTQK